MTRVAAVAVEKDDEQKYTEIDTYRKTERKRGGGVSFEETQRRRG